MFSEDAIKKAVEQNQEEQKKMKQKLLPRGFHILELVSIDLKKSKAGDPMFVITVKKGDDKNEEFRTVSEYLVIQESGLTTKEGINANVYRMLAFFANAFKYVPKQPDADDPYGDVEKQFKQFEGKQFRGIIAHKMELLPKANKAIAKAELIFKRCTDLADQTLNEKVVDANQYFTDLTPRDKAILRGDIIPDQKPGTESGGSPITDFHGVPDLGDLDENPDKLPF
jgi:hypothetical protein